MLSNSDHRTLTAAIIIKAAPVIGAKHGETVCVACIDYDGSWHRLYPVPFKDLKPEQRFKRWDLIEVDWYEPKDDKRTESKRIKSPTLRVVGSVPPRERHSFARRAVVASLKEQKALGRSFALIRPDSPTFRIEKKSQSEIAKEVRRRAQFIRQADLFGSSVIDERTIPYKFVFRYRHDGVIWNSSCIDWETEATFFKWRDTYGEEIALKNMQERFGGDLVEQGVAFAMGTHRVPKFDRWLLSGLIRAPESRQATLL